MMKSILLVASLLFLSLIASPSSVSASEFEGVLDDIAGEVLCLPGSFISPGGDCTPLGPSAYISRMAEMGVTFPLRSVSGQVPDPSLTFVNIRYGEVVRQNARVYASLDDAVKKGEVIKKIDSPYSFISYTDEAVR